MRIDWRAIWECKSLNDILKIQYALISGCLAYCLTSVKGQYNTQELDDVCYIVTCYILSITSICTLSLKLFPIWDLVWPSYPLGYAIFLEFLRIDWLAQGYSNYQCWDLNSDHPKPFLNYIFWSLALSTTLIAIQGLLICSCPDKFNIAADLGLLFWIGTSKVMKFPESKCVTFATHLPCFR